MSSKSDKSTIGSKLSWFLAEFLVVLTGVLVAVALNSWWQSMQDAKTETKYLEQLTEDLNSTLQTLEADSVKSAKQQDDLSKLIQVFRQEELPPEDSLRRWFHTGLTYDISGPSLGTVEAIVSTEDLQLIQSDSLRKSLPDYLDKMRTYNARMLLLESQVIDEFRYVFQVVDYVGMRLSSGGRAETDSLLQSRRFDRIPKNARQIKFGLEFPDLFKDEAAYVSLNYVYELNFNLWENRNKMLTSTRSLIKTVENSRQ